MSPLGLPQLSVDPVGVWPLYLGTRRDFSGNGNHSAVVNGLHWGQSGDRDGVQADNGYLLVNGSTSLTMLSGMTVFLSADFRSQITNEYLLLNLTDNLAAYFTNAFAIFNDGAAARTLATTAIIGSSSIAYSIPASGVGNVYLDGASIGALNGISTISPTPGDWRIIGTGVNNIRSPCELLMIYPGELSAPEIAQLHTYSQARFTPRLQWPGGGLSTGNSEYVDNIQTAQVTMANEVGPEPSFSNTGLSITSGTFSLREDDTGRYIYCVGAGTLRRRLIGADTFTISLFTETGGATLTPDATGFDLVFGAGDIVRAVQLTT